MSRTIKASSEYTQNAAIDSAGYVALKNNAATNPEAFWAEQAKNLRWLRSFDRVLEWTPPYAKWFVNGRTNVSLNCLDRLVDEGYGDKNAIIWEGEPGGSRTLTYRELLSSVSKCANALRSLKISKGDRVIIYMPLVPEAVVAMLACARLGAVHSVVFGGFSAEAIRDRANDAQASAIITADGGYRRGSIIPLKESVDKAIEAGIPTVRHVLVLKRVGQPVPWKEGRDIWWHDAVDIASDVNEPVSMDSEDPLFILYTSGTTGKPKGIVHTTGGYLVQTNFSTRLVFDLKKDDIYWCTADIGWITGHSYVVYGPLSNGATVFLYEGSPDFPDRSRFWRLIEQYGITVFYTAPTAIRAFMRWGSEWIKKADLSTLRLLGTVGEPINPDVWLWYYQEIGNSRCPIVDTWWQTETGSIMLSPVPGAVDMKPGSATVPLPGIDLAVVDGEGKECAADVPGYLIIRKPWPSMLRGVYNDDQRFRSQYWSRYPGVYFTGDGARRDKDGYIWVIGRVDDVLNVSGHRIGSAEVESALVSHPSVAEAAVVGIPDDLRGQAVVAFVTLKAGIEKCSTLEDELKVQVVTQIGALARPSAIKFTDALPKTRSGKIMRRLLREIAIGNAVQGDTTTLEDAQVLESLRQDEE